VVIVFGDVMDLKSGHGSADYNVYAK